MSKLTRLSSWSHSQLIRGGTLAVALAMTAGVHADTPMNVLFITIDDLSRESMGIHGNPIPNITPNMDRIGHSGLRFEHAHVQTANCTPSRNIMQSGQYAHKNGIYTVSNVGSGNQEIKNTIAHTFQLAGYHTGIMGKNSHMSPFDPYTGFDVEYGGYGSTKSPSLIYPALDLAFTDAENAGKPLYFNLNIFDPHVSWFGWQDNAPDGTDNEEAPSFIYTPTGNEYDAGDGQGPQTFDIPYPSWFPTLTTAEQTAPGETYGIIDEVTAYYNTVKRADDSIGEVLRVLDDRQAWDNTIIVFYSDHGTELPGAKTQLYQHSTVSPCFVYWPGVTAADSENTSHVIASMDLYPSLCDMAGIPIPAGLDGRSFAPIVKGETVSNWPDHVYKQSLSNSRMRAVQTTQFLYIFNPWSNGTSSVSTVSTGTLSWELIEAATSQEAQDWAQKFKHRVVEELYDISTDPDCKINLIDDANHSATLDQLRAAMEQSMIDTDDELILQYYQTRDDDFNFTLDTLNAYISAQQAVTKANKNIPEKARHINHDPYDDWVVFDYTILEPAGEWGIWGSSDGNYTIDEDLGESQSGKSAIKVTGDVDVSQLETNDFLNTSNLSLLKLDVMIAANNVKANDADFAITFLYNDGTNGWLELTGIDQSSLDKNDLRDFNNNGKTVYSYFNLEFETPDGGLPEECKFAIKVDFGGNTSGEIYLDSLRLTGWADWTSVANDDFESDTGSWTGGNLDSSSQINGTGSLKITGGNSAQLTPSIDASELGFIRYEGLFRTTNFTTSSAVIVEYYTGTSWDVVESIDYVLVQQNGFNYSFCVDLNNIDHIFTDQFQLRLRSDASSSEILYLDELAVTSRPVVFIPEATAPDGQNLDYNTDINVPLNVTAPGLLSGLSADEQSTYYPQIITDPSSGAVSNLQADGSFTFTPDSNFIGTDSFTFNFTDGELTGDTYTATITVSNTLSPDLQMETGVVQLGTSWSTINLTNTYSSPIIVCTPTLPDTDELARIVRVRNTSASSFQAKLQQPDGGTISTNSPVHYIVVEEGQWTLADGSKLEAQLLTSSQTAGKGNWDNVDDYSYQHSFTSPVVLGQVMTTNGDAWSTFIARASTNRADNPTFEDCQVGKHNGKQSGAARADELLGVIVFETGSGAVGDANFEAKIGDKTIKGIENASPPFIYDLDDDLLTPAVAILSQSAIQVNEGCWPALFGASPLGANSIDLIVDEDSQSGTDDERVHNVEHVAYLVFDSSFSYSELEADSNNDGVPDSWYQEHNIDPNTPDQADTVGANGHTYGDSYIAGLDPNDPSSRFIISDTQLENNGSEHQLKWPSVDGRVYSLYSSTDLVDWQLKQSNIEATAPENSTSVAVPEGEDKVFYKLEVQIAGSTAGP